MDVTQSKSNTVSTMSSAEHQCLLREKVKILIPRILNFGSLYLKSKVQYCGECTILVCVSGDCDKYYTISMPEHSPCSILDPDPLISFIYVDKRREMREQLF